MSSRDEPAAADVADIPIDPTAEVTGRRGRPTRQAKASRPANARREPAAPDIANLPIDPTAEVTGRTPAGVSPEQEVDFYRQAGEQYRLAHNEQNLGQLGKFFGSSASAPTNIAGMVVILSFLLYCATFVVDTKADLTSARTLFGGLIGSALSFIFGAATKK
jgi:hypothetical protein